MHTACGARIAYLVSSQGFLDMQLVCALEHLHLGVKFWHLDVKTTSMIWSVETRHAYLVDFPCLYPILSTWSGPGVSTHLRLSHAPRITGHQNSWVCGKTSFWRQDPGVSWADVGTHTDAFSLACSLLEAGWFGLESGDGLAQEGHLLA